MTSDMDELYRKAAENYPLNTGKPAWDALLQKMRSNEKEHEDNKNNNNKNWFKTVLLLLIFSPLALKDIQFDKKVFLSDANNTTTVNIPAYQDTPLPGTENPSAGKAGTIANPTVPSTISSAKLRTFNGPIHDKLSRQELPGNKLSKTEVKEDLSNLNSAANIAIHQKETISENKFNEASTDLQKNKEEKKLIEHPGLVTTIQQAPTNQKEDRKQKSKKFYAGIIAGPEVSSVKMQNFHKVGFNAGIITGVQLNNKIQVETGLLIGRKYYSSNGEYFNTNKITLPPGTRIKEVKGYCDMTEIPLIINYTVKQNTGHKIYATAGVSSYIMKKELYDFEVTRNGYSYPRSMEYDNPGSYLFAALSLGVGYDKKIGKNGNLRISPSIKLPLKKMGTGSLPIQSGTLYLGYTYKLF